MRPAQPERHKKNHREKLPVSHAVFNLVFKKSESKKKMQKKIHRLIPFCARNGLKKKFYQKLFSFFCFSSMGVPNFFSLAPEPFFSNRTSSFSVFCHFWFLKL